MNWTGRGRWLGAGGEGEGAPELAGWVGDGVIEPEQEERRDYGFRQEGEGFCYIMKSCLKYR